MKFKPLQYSLLTLFTIGLCFLVREIVLVFRLLFVQNFAQEYFRFGAIGLWLFIAVGAAITLFTKTYKKYPILFTLLTAGIFSNILEKFIFGYVIDYIYVGIGVANLADVLIYVGIFVIAILEIKNPSPKL